MIIGGLALKLARRELRGGLKGFRVFLACLTLGVGAIAAVQTVTSGILTSLERDGAAILGGDVAGRMLYTEVAPAQATWPRRWRKGTVSGARCWKMRC